MNSCLFLRALALVVSIGTSHTYSANCKQDAKLVEKGKAPYTTNCATCHGDKGDGQGPAGVALKARNFLKDTFKQGDTVEKIFETTHKGVPGTTMVGFPQIPEKDRCAVANYVFSLRAAAKK